MVNTSPKIYKVLLMILPVGVVIGTIVFMTMYFYMEREEERERNVIAAYGLRVEDLDDMVGKFTDRIGLRDHGTEEGQRGLAKASSTIEGRLGPQNVGYTVHKGEGMAIGDRVWKSLWVDLRGSSSADEVVLVAVSYAGAGELADSNALSTVMMLASSMAREQLEKTLRFVFLPLQQAPEKQNQWLRDLCIQKGERCIGIIGIQALPGSPDLGGEHWQVHYQGEAGSEWWRFVRGRGDRPEALGSAVWLSTSVYYQEAWLGRRGERLQQTIGEARQLENWLRAASR